jgi:hypothetical protein
MKGRERRKTVQAVAESHLSEYALEDMLTESLKVLYTQMPKQKDDEPILPDTPFPTVCKQLKNLVLQRELDQGK